MQCTTAAHNKGLNAQPAIVHEWKCQASLTQTHSPHADSIVQVQVHMPCCANTECTTKHQSINCHSVSFWLSLMVATSYILTPAMHNRSLRTAQLSPTHCTTGHAINPCNAQPQPTHCATVPYTLHNRTRDHPCNAQPQPTHCATVPYTLHNRSLHNGANGEPLYI